MLRAMLRCGKTSAGRRREKPTRNTAAGRRGVSAGNACVMEGDSL
jgi:hypothetical protein